MQWLLEQPVSLLEVRVTAVFNEDNEDKSSVPTTGH